MNIAVHCSAVTDINLNQLIKNKKKLPKRNHLITHIHGTLAGTEQNTEWRKLPNFRSATKTHKQTAEHIKTGDIPIITRSATSNQIRLVAVRMLGCAA